MARGDAFPPHAFLSSGGSATDFDTLGGLESVAFGVDALGHFVGRAQKADGQVRPFPYKNGTMKDFTLLLSAADAATVRSLTSGMDTVLKIRVTVPY